MPLRQMSCGDLYELESFPSAQLGPRVQNRLERQGL
jgi:hypothetical protein